MSMITLGTISTLISATEKLYHLFGSQFDQDSLNNKQIKRMQFALRRIYESTAILEALLQQRLVSLKSPIMKSNRIEFIEKYRANCITIRIMIVDSVNEIESASKSFNGWKDLSSPAELRIFGLEIRKFYQSLFDAVSFWESKANSPSKREIQLTIRALNRVTKSTNGLYMLMNGPENNLTLVATKARQARRITKNG